MPARRTWNGMQPRMCPEKGGRSTCGLLHEHLATYNRVPHVPSAARAAHCSSEREPCHTVQGACATGSTDRIEGEVQTTPCVHDDDHVPIQISVSAAIYPCLVL